MVKLMDLSRLQRDFIVRGLQREILCLHSLLNALETDSGLNGDYFIETIRTVEEDMRLLRRSIKD